MRGGECATTGRKGSRSEPTSQGCSASSTSTRLRLTHENRPSAGRAGNYAIPFKQSHCDVLLPYYNGLLLGELFCKSPKSSSSPEMNNSWTSWHAGKGP